MSQFAELLRARNSTPAKPANSANPAADISNFSNISRGSEASSVVDDTALTPAQEAARKEVLARLEAHPSLERAFVARWEADTLIVSIAIRGLGTGDLSIPRERIRQGDLAAYAELLDCLSSQGVAS